MDDFVMQVEMRCPVCGGTKFLQDEDDLETPVTCIMCNRVLTREELREANMANMEAIAEQEAHKLAEKAIKDMFKRLK